MQLSDTFRAIPRLKAIQTLISERAVEAFDMSVLPRTSRLNVEGLHLVLSQPPLQDAGNELAAIYRYACGRAHHALQRDSPTLQ